MRGPKQFHDVVGYYNRFDVFSLSVERRRHEPVTWTSNGTGQFPRILDDEAAPGLLR